MAKSTTSKRDESREVTRRALIKWGIAASAALGVSRSRLAEIFEKTAGKGVAYAAEDSVASFVIAIPMGNGGLANMNLLWPHVDVAEANNNGFSIHAVGQYQRVVGTDKPLVRNPQTPWMDLAGKKQITCFMAGNNQTHVNNATFNVGQNPLLPTLAAIQTSRSSVIPFVGVGDIAYGAAPGAPAISTVGEADDVVGLFNSAASRAGGLLSTTQHADLYKAHYDAYASLNKSAQNATTTRSYNTAKSAAKFLGTNLAALLQITPEDEARYGIDGNMPGNIAAMARGFIVAIKAFKLGLTNGVALPGLRNDPHGLFDGGQAPNVAANLQKAFDGLMTDLNNTVDQNGKTLGDVTTIVVWGDTPKQPLDKNGWGDGTPQNSNWVYAYGAGYLKTGWFGGITRNGDVTGFDPATGAEVPYNGGNTMRAAAAAVAYAVARGDMRRVQDFVNGLDINGIVNLTLL
jgi:hypothetical protein